MPGTVSCGLSPLARGTPAEEKRRDRQPRFIPAGAGNTITAATEQVEFAVYPRWRGEHFSDFKNYLNANGLSPLARGTPGGTRHPVSPQRFIPAGAGNTRSGQHPHQCEPVYPRWRGEHKVRVRVRRVTPGLSPLARGTRTAGRGVHAGKRFIPAGAGNTASTTERAMLIAVYPRWRGEHASAIARVPRVCGLSPLARGTHHAADHAGKGARFIPAGAGNTAKYTAEVEKRAGLSPLARGTL